MTLQERHESSDDDEPLAVKAQRRKTVLPRCDSLDQLSTNSVGSSSDDGPIPPRRRRLVRLKIAIQHADLAAEGTEGAQQEVLPSAVSDVGSQPLIAQLVDPPSRQRGGISQPDMLTDTIQSIFEQTGCHNVAQVLAQLLERTEAHGNTGVSYMNEPLDIGHEVAPAQSGVEELKQEIGTLGKNIDVLQSALKDVLVRLASAEARQQELRPTPETNLTTDEVHLPTKTQRDWYGTGTGPNVLPNGNDEWLGDWSNRCHIARITYTSWGQREPDKCSKCKELGLECFTYTDVGKLRFSTDSPSACAHCRFKHTQCSLASESLDELVSTSFCLEHNRG